MPQDDSQTEQALAPQPAETPADTPTARHRQISDRYGEKTGHKIDVTLRDRTSELDKTQKAQQAFDDAPIGKEEKAEKALKKARKAYEEAKAELESWKAVKEEHDKIVQAEAKVRAEQDALRYEQAVEEERRDNGRVPIETDEKSVWDFDGKYDGNGIRFSEREEEGAGRSLFEQQLLALDKLAESHKENLNIRRMAIEAMNGQMKVSAIFFA